jgi:release factor glutamine methyltransferase
MTPESDDGRVTEARSAEAMLVARLRAAGCVFAEDEARLLVSAARTPDELARMADRRVAGWPLEQVVGWAEFCGLRVVMEPGVFVPRRRTELLVTEARAVLAGCASDRRSPPVVVDLCCGSGAIGAAVVAGVAWVELYAVDIDPAAVRCARRNLATAQVLEGDLFAPLPETLRGRVDVVVANTPYVPTDELALMPAEARLHEPRVALDGGADGLAVQRRLIAEAPAWLMPGGHLLVETSARQAEQAANAFAHNGFAATVARSDELDATVVIGTRPAPAIRPGVRPASRSPR